MESRTTWSKVTFPRAFSLPGSDVVFPPGDYDLVVEEERLQGLTFDAYRRTSAFLEVATNPRFPGRTEMRPVTDADLEQARSTRPDLVAIPAAHADADTVPRKDTR